MSIACPAKSPLLIAAIAFATALCAHAQTRDALEVQKARAEHVTSRGKQIFYTQKFDLSGLPAYAPEQKVSGTIRLWGNNYIADSNLGDEWERGFKKFHPDVTFDFSGLKSGLVATAGLVAGTADIVGNRRITFAEVESFERMFNYDPLEISMAMGSYDVPGWTFALAVFGTWVLGPGTALAEPETLYSDSGIERPPYQQILDSMGALATANRFMCLQEGHVSLEGEPRAHSREDITRAYFGT